jgi:menaquinol-cytochrome c reductase cytochrome b/c subunit
MAELTATPRQPGAAPNHIDEAKRQKLLELVRGRALARPTDLADDEVMVWPSLVVVEAVCATVFLMILTLLSIFISAPLTEHANVNQTPNPSKAPWYFLNLQELLLHMHPALAGVIVPSVALALIAIIPYFDRDTRDVGKWFGTAKAKSIAWFTTWFTTIVLFLEVIFDEEIGVKPLMTNLAAKTGLEIFVWPSVVNIIVPMILMNGPIVILVWLLKKFFKPEGARDWIIALFTGFFVSYIVLTIVGTFLRGQGMHLMWPWDPRMIRVE